jgi:glucan phosphoethanolaminetransferase (alkaline phosphatase superfamily)
VKQLALFIGFTLAYLIADVLIRSELLALYSSKQIGFYLLSIVTSLVLFTSVFLLLNKLRHRRFLFHFLLGTFCFYLVIAVIGSYIFFFFNGFYPNYYTYEYFRNEPQSAFVLFRDSIDLRDTIIFLLGFSAFYWLLKKAIDKEISWNRLVVVISGFVMYLSLLGFLTVKIKKYDQCLTVDSNFTAAVTRHFFDLETQRTFKGKGLGARTPIYLPKTEEHRDFNVLVVLFESLRKHDLQAYGYQRGTTPNLYQFQQDHTEEFFVFNHPYAVSTTTMLAVPAVLTGIGPFQSPEVFYSQPMIWEYGTMLNYRTFFLSSHTFQWYRFDRFYAKERLDHIWNKEKSGKEFFNDLGIDDSHTIDHLNEKIREKGDRPFFGVVQLNATHYPYKIPDKFKKWKGSFLDEYDNSIYYQDYVLGKMFAELKRSGQLENTVIIFTSDHGESLKDHNNIGHVDSYYAETISVPLMIYLPDNIRPGLKRNELRKNRYRTVSNIDIAPTLIDLLNLKDHKAVQQVWRNYTGYSLFGPVPEDRSLIIMNNNEVARFKVGISLIKGNYHYIYRMNIVPNRQELYDIRKDPKEKKNLIDVVSKKDLKELMDSFREYEVSEKYLPK